MKRISLLLLYIGIATTMTAQRAAFHKMSSLVRQAAIEASLQKRKAISHNRELQKKSPTITAFVKINGDAERIFSDHRCRNLAKIGNIYIVSIPLNQLAGLSNHSDVERIEAGKRADAQMNIVSEKLNALPVYAGTDLPEAYTGKGVVVGVQDIGFDLTHPNFYSSDMSEYRIKALWDQLSKDTLGTSLPVGRDYIGKDALLAIGHPSDGLTQTHGTHTAGIAAGSGAEGNGTVSPYKGIAYDADIVMVANAAGNNIALIDTADYYKYTYATDALGFKYMFDYADTQGKPCVINFSEGGHQDFMGYDQLYYEILDSLTGPGHILVASAGNDADHVNYIHKPSGQKRAGGLIIGNMDYGYYTVKTDRPFTFITKIYNDNANPFVKEITTGEVLASTDSLYSDTILIDGTPYRWHVAAYPSSYNKVEMVYDIRVSAEKIGHTTPVSLEVVGENANIELYRIAGYIIPNSLDPELPSGNNSHSIHSPSSAPSVICVGSTGYRTEFVNYLGETKAYKNGENGSRSSFSGVGPTLDGRTKPDVMAPGQNVISSYSSFFIGNPDNAGYPLSSDVRHFEYNGRTYAWNCNSGTSMATPVVAGAIALWLQAYPKLTPEDCIDIFSKTCTHYDASLSYPNNLYGYGQIDILEGLKEVLKKATAGIENVPSKEQLQDDRIYSLDGLYIGKDAARLPKGIYIRNHKKFVNK